MEYRETSGLLVCEDYTAMSAFVLSLWRKIAPAALRRKGYFCVALSGGETPRGLYRLLADSGKMLPWTETHIFLVDERFVPEGHPDSNFGMIRSILATSGDSSVAAFHPVPTDGPSPEDGAVRYERVLKTFFGLGEGGYPVFDLLILGIGADGHTASLLPGTKALKERGRLAVAVADTETAHARVTLTLPVLNSARNIVFLVSGPGKASVVKRVLEKGDRSLPAAMVKPLDGALYYVMDKSAAAGLDRAAAEGRFRACE
jgi:6-phosphogluconolactonase